MFICSIWIHMDHFLKKNFPEINTLLFYSEIFVPFWAYIIAVESHLGVYFYRWEKVMLWNWNEFFSDSSLYWCVLTPTCPIHCFMSKSINKHYHHAYHPVSLLLSGGEKNSQYNDIECFIRFILPVLLTSAWSWTTTKKSQ